jgi:hypothetical protein
LRTRLKTCDHIVFTPLKVNPLSRKPTLCIYLSLQTEADFHFVMTTFLEWALSLALLRHERPNLRLCAAGRLTLKLECDRKITDRRNWDRRHAVCVERRRTQRRKAANCSQEKLTCLCVTSNTEQTCWQRVCLKTAVLLDDERQKDFRALRHVLKCQSSLHRKRYLYNRNFPREDMGGPVVQDILIKITCTCVSMLPAYTRICYVSEVIKHNPFPKRRHFLGNVSTYDMYFII